MTDFRFSGGRKTNGPLIHAFRRSNYCIFSLDFTSKLCHPIVTVCKALLPERVTSIGFYLVTRIENSKVTNRAFQVCNYVNKAN